MKGSETRGMGGSGILNMVFLIMYLRSGMVFGPFRSFFVVPISRNHSEQTENMLEFKMYILLGVQHENDW